MSSLEHIFDNLLHVWLQPLLLQLQHLNQSSADYLAHFAAGIVCQSKQAADIPATAITVNKERSLVAAAVFCQGDSSMQEYMRIDPKLA